MCRHCMELIVISKAWGCQEVHVGHLFELLGRFWSDKGG